MNKEFGKKLRELRKRNGLSIDEAARLLGVSRSAIGMYEQRRRMPSLELVRKIAYIYSTDTNTIIDGVSNTSIKKLETELNTLIAKRDKLLQKVKDNPTSLDLVEELQKFTRRMAEIQTEIIIQSKPRRPSKLVPVVSTLKPILGQIKAGLPKLAAEDVLEYVPVRVDLNIDYVLIVVGDSLTGVGIEPGDRLLLMLQNMET